ncbi:sperm-tail PG-rich repeat-containing protein 2-like [Vanessa cardui]|uniref:sperm-tail PG-rich repeat-containing protein 2-like n=1 Tax=Vanessa cardui TaxID=171605 RepID=UPI001F13F780|nr:sperm-tail PG-rich repeat-containing protein 2-like [Vanessa cardui]
MAYNLCERFPKVKQPVQLLDPGSYQNVNSLPVKPNKVPFLSKAPRNTQSSCKIWTHALYFGDIKPKIPNCTTISSITPRFAYEKIKHEDVEEILCQCGEQSPCNCSAGQEKTEVEDEIKCHKYIRRRLFKGQTIRSALKEGLSVPSKKDFGFNILPNGSKERVFKPSKEDCPPFYDARVIESTAFYRGCKWSKWSSQRGDKSLKLNPGPADYNIDGPPPSREAMCIEKIRALKRKTSKQLRFIEKVQRQNILDALPGPASYSPTFPKGTDLNFLGPKAKRFLTSKCDDMPNPTSYFVKRDFDIDNSPIKPCHAILPIPAPFGVQACRFKYRPGEGPSPASYTINNPLCQVIHCNKAPFGSLSKRFKDKDSFDKDTQDFDDENMENYSTKQHQLQNEVPNPTWVFKSKTARMKPLLKTNCEPRPTDLPISSGLTKKRLLPFQYNCPFYSSEARFQNWFNWIPVQGQEKTPGPAYYNPEKPKCFPAVRNGPICQSVRFTSHATPNPAPNTYNVEGGLESILTTYNEKLKNNIKNKHKYVWKVPVEPRKLSLDEQVGILLNKSIALLDIPDIFEYSKCEDKKEESPPPDETEPEQTKLLRCFLYAKKVKQYY